MKLGRTLTRAAAGRPPVTRAGWAPAAGAALGLAGLVESVLRATGSGVILSIAILVALCGTVPLAVAGGHPLPAAATITLATALTVVLYKAPLGSAAAALLIAWFLVVRRRIRRVRSAAAERDASRRAIEDKLLELTARGERARIARELHDVVAHHISMISIQADTARLAVPGMPQDGVKHLLAIGDTARTALTEMQRLLGVLREDAGDRPAARRPQPGLQQLLELVDETRDAGGASTRLIVRGEVADLDPGIELTAYRIVQEALTNARRHAPGAAVDVEIEYAADALHLQVRDNGPGLWPAGGGHGLLGMRERAATVGGELRAGPAVGSGFLIKATLPADRARA